MSEMREIPVLMTDKEFELELNTLRIKMEDEKQKGHDWNRRTSYLIGWVTNTNTGSIHTPEQLDKIFDLAN